MGVILRINRPINSSGGSPPLVAHRLGNRPREGGGHVQQAVDYIGFLPMLDTCAAREHNGFTVKVSPDNRRNKMAKGKQKVTVNGSVVKVEYPTIKKFVSVDVDKLDTSVTQAALIHGVKQRLGDAASGGTAQEKYEMAGRIVEAFHAGQWELADRITDDSIVIEAVARIKERDEEEIRAIVERKGPDETVKVWRTNGKVKAEILNIRAERAQTAADEAEDFEV